MIQKDSFNIKQFQERVIPWLLEEDNPPVRYLTLNNILKETKTAQKNKINLMNYEPTQKILKNMEIFLEDDDRAYWKYKGKYWQVIFLGQFLADCKDPGIARLSKSILGHRKWIWKHGGQCLTANLLAAFMRLGYSEHPVVLEEIKNLATNVVSNNGIMCGAMDYSLLSHCYMAIPKLLHCFSEIPPKNRSQTVKDALKILLDTVLKNEVYIYVPENRKEWHKILEKQPKKADLPEGQTVKSWISKKQKEFINSHGLGIRKEKPGWLKFGFPLHYNSDILETMYAIARLKIPMNASLKKPLQIIKEKMTEDGKWILENSLNGKMWVDIEEKGKPSKWITYFALFVLQHFESKP